MGFLFVVLLALLCVGAGEELTDLFDESFRGIADGREEGREEKRQQADQTWTLLSKFVKVPSSMNVDAWDARTKGLAELWTTLRSGQRALGTEWREVILPAWEMRSPSLPFFAADPLRQRMEDYTRRVAKLVTDAQLGREKMKDYLQSNGNIPFLCFNRDFFEDCLIASSDLLNLTSSMKESWGLQTELLQRWFLPLQNAILGVVLTACAILTLGVIFALALFWKVVRRVSAPTVLSLMLLTVAYGMRMVLFAIFLNAHITGFAWSDNRSHLMGRFFERLSFAVNLVVVFLFFWMWSGAAREMSRTEQSPLWTILRVGALILTCGSAAFGVASAIFFSLAIEYASIDGYWTLHGFLTISVVQFLLVVGLLSFSVYVYNIARESSWGDKVKVPFRRMLVAIALLFISSVLFCAHQITGFFLMSVFLAMALEISSSFLFFTAMCIVFVSYFYQMRTRLRYEDHLKESVAHGDEPPGLDMANYDY